ncbi:nucleoid-associated protein, partial [Bacteroidales bacterium OttesenSCG-928-E04]|nr:nucleoid-associated protein [Bacteroidales bacterium OttesenSCG-928-E04]
EVDAIGLFKSEVKDPFMKVEMVDDRFVVFNEQGINLQKIDKGCLIYNQNRDGGYIVEIVDNTGKGQDAAYWKEDFLQLQPRQDEFFNTNHYLSMCKSFITEELPEQYEISKTDQIALLNRSVGYFKAHDDFDIEQFEQKVIGNQEIIQDFNKFKENYQQEKEIVLEDRFNISAPAVKKQNRVFKSVIKLDKNFHIYVHGNHNLIEQGVDESGRKFYRIFYEEEL